MAIVSQVNISNLTQISDVTRILQPFLSQAFTAFNNGINFTDNIRATIVGVSFSSANKNQIITHGLPVTPIGYFPIMLSGPGIIYNGLGVSLTLTSTIANLACSTTNIFASILFF